MLKNWLFQNSRGRHYILESIKRAKSFIAINTEGASMPQILIFNSSLPLVTFRVEEGLVNMVANIDENQPTMLRRLMAIEE